VPGTNSRLDALQAAVLRVKLSRLAGWNEERRERVRAYDLGLAGLPGLGLPQERAGARSAWHLYTVRVADRDGLRACLGARGIATAVHYPKPVHLQPALAGLAHGELPVSEQLAREVLSLPLYPELPLDVVARICGEVRAFCGVAAA
jgi:dTDP-4-amino-4,6-dideoxygalactose transaminase